MQQTKVFTEDSFKMLSETQFTGTFNPWYLKNFTPPSIEFCRKVNEMLLTKEDENGVVSSISLTIQAMRPLEEVYNQIREKVKDVYIWKEKHHHKEFLDDGKVYHDDWTYSFYLKNVGDEVIIREKRHPHDFRNLLQTDNLELVLTVEIKDVRGYKKE